MNSRHFLMFGLFAIGANSASAAVVVDYNGTAYDYVTAAADQSYQRVQTTPTAGDYDGVGGANDSIIGIPFSDTTPLSPSTASYNSTLPSATFFGGLERIRLGSSTDGTGFDRAYVDDSGNKLVNRLRVGTTDGARTYRTAGVFAWSVGATNVDLTQDVTITMTSSISGVDKLYLAAKQGGQWYVGPQMSLTGLTYDADTNNFFKVTNFGSVINEDMSSGFSAQNLDDVSMIGVYFEQDLVPYNGTAYLSQFELTRFTVNAALVPEPASLALLGLGGLCLMGRRRR